MKYQPSIPQRTVYDEDIMSDGRKRGLADKRTSIKQENNDTTKQLRTVLLTRKLQSIEPKSICGDLRV